MTRGSEIFVFEEEQWSSFMSEDTTCFADNEDSPHSAKGPILVTNGLQPS